MKYVGIAKVVSISAVTSKLNGYGSTYSDGMIYVDIPELGLTGENRVLCRYGFCIPYALVKIDQRLWVEPTLNDNERWVYTGYVDCMVDAINSTTESILYITANQYVKLKSDKTIELKSDDSKIEMKGGEKIKLTYATGTTLEMTSGLIELTATDIKISGKLEVTKTSKFDDDIEIDGTVDATGDISSEAEVTANSTGAKSTLSKHMHPTAVPGPASTPTPGT